MNRQYRVVRDYAPQPGEPIRFERGEAIVVERRSEAYPGWWWCSDKRGRSGWVHERYFTEDDYRYVATEDYDGSELSARAGEVLTSLIEHDGRALCVNRDGEQGWVPLAHLEAFGAKGEL